MAKIYIAETPGYTGILKEKNGHLTASDIIACYNSDAIAHKTIDACIVIWGMAIVNLVSIFDPEKVVVGGGIFGPAVRFLNAIKQEASKWAQPLSDKMYALEASALGKDAGVYGSAFAALQMINNNIN